MSSPIEHVADTAFWVATYRADEGKRPDALFSDPLAERLVAGRGRVIAAGMGSGAITAWTVAIRTRIIDDYVLAAVADGFDTVLNLGAGLDTRPYRMDVPGTLRWIEVDFASTIEFKEAKLADEQPRCQLERRKVDLGCAEARRALLADVEASSQRVLVITEGVVPYLTNEAVTELARDLHACASMQRWVLEYFGNGGLFLRRLLARGRKKQLARAPFRFEPRDWTALFAKQGWHPRETRYVAEEGERLRRPPPLPRWLRAIMTLMPRALRGQARRRYGYAVLERVSRAQASS